MNLFIQNNYSKLNDLCDQIFDYFNLTIYDLENKLKMGKKFLADGCKLKITLRYRGREMSRQDLGQDLLTRVLSSLSEHAQMEKDSPLMGRKKSIILAPK